MRLHRPYIPLAIRVQVAERQLCAQGDWGKIAVAMHCELTHGRRLKNALRLLFGDHPYHLDHDPALVNRQRTRSGNYIPGANDPVHLVYRTKVAHDIKTRIRGDGAQRSDLSQRRYLKKVARNRQKVTPDPGVKARQPRRKWASRPFPKGRKIGRKA